MGQIHSTQDEPAWTLWCPTPPPHPPPPASRCLLSGDTNSSPIDRYFSSPFTGQTSSWGIELGFQTRNVRLIVVKVAPKILILKFTCFYKMGKSIILILLSVICRFVGVVEVLTADLDTKDESAQVPWTDNTGESVDWCSQPLSDVSFLCSLLSRLFLILSLSISPSIFFSTVLHLVPCDSIGRNTLRQERQVYFQDPVWRKRKGKGGERYLKFYQSCST